MSNLSVFTMVMLGSAFIGGFISALLLVKAINSIKAQKELQREMAIRRAASEQVIFGKIITINDVRKWSKEKKVAKSNELQIPKCVRGNSKRKTKSGVKNSSAYVKQVKELLENVPTERPGRYTGVTREERWQQWSEKRSREAC